MVDRASPPRSARSAWRTFSREVEVKERRRIAARRATQSAWFGLGMFGLVGWSVAIPVVLCIGLGVWIDGRYPSRFSWTLMLLAAGVVLGCLNGWYWLSGERRVIDRESRDMSDDRRASADGPTRDRD